MQIQKEVKEGKIRKIAPVHLLLNILGCVYFVYGETRFCTIMNASESSFDKLMQERIEVIVEFVRNALKVD